MYSTAYSNPAAAQFADDEEPFRTSDLLILNQPNKTAAGWSSLWGRLRSVCSSAPTWLIAALWLSAIGAVIACAALLVTLLFPFSAKDVSYTPECFMSLGGGASLAGGSLPPPNPQRCTDQIRKYFTQGADFKGGQGGEYYTEVKDVANAAIAYFKALQQVTPSSPDQVMVFDIDETVLSNAAEWMGGGAGELLPTPVASTKQQLYSFDRPALAAVHELFLFLYHSHYSIAFITGRNEDSRNGTMANLELAGYGTPCPPPPAAGTPAWSAPRSSAQPCYVALHLREVEDTRLASIYKPERRQRLQQQGFTLAGNMGDQHSDLAGLSPAAASWKLPNPVYYIL